MTYDARVYQTLASCGIKGTKLAWPLGNAPALPWFTYERTRNGYLHADNESYFLLPRYRIELYVKENDPDLVERFERAIRKLGSFTRKDDEWLDSESCLLITYTLTLTHELQEGA